MDNNTTCVLNDKIIDCLSISKNRLDEIKNQLLEIKNDRMPKIVVVSCDDSLANTSYIKGIIKACDYVGIEVEKCILSKNISEIDLLKQIDVYNNDKNTDAILLHMPLPDHISHYKIVESINPTKDVDCLHPLNSGYLFCGHPRFVPCTPAGIMMLIDLLNIDVKGKHAVIVGRSNVVGKPISQLLLQKDAYVSIVHSKTNNIEEITKHADILVVAVGHANLIKKEHLKEGAIVFDVGINFVDNKLCGDVDIDDVIDKVSLITPVPKGLGTLTNVVLMENIIKSYNER